MNRIRDLIADLVRLFAGLSPRERMLVTLAGVGAVIFISSIVMTTVNSSMNRREASIAEKQLSLEQVAVFARSYGENERARKAIEAKLGGPPVRLMSMMQELTDKNGLTVGSMNDRGESTDGDIKESVVEVSIASTPVDKLTAILNELERKPQPVKVRKLRVKRNSADETLNVTLTVSSYQLARK